MTNPNIARTIIAMHIRFFSLFPFFALTSSYSIKKRLQVIDTERNSFMMQRLKWIEHPMKAQYRNSDK